jgi:hypothetical protein
MPNMMHLPMRAFVSVSHRGLMAVLSVPVVPALREKDVLKALCWYC